MNQRFIGVVCTLVLCCVAVDGTNKGKVGTTPVSDPAVQKPSEFDAVSFKALCAVDYPACETNYKQSLTDYETGSSKKNPEIDAVLAQIKGIVEKKEAVDIKAVTKDEFKQKCTIFVPGKLPSPSCEKFFKENTPAAMEIFKEMIKANNEKKGWEQEEAGEIKLGLKRGAPKSPAAAAAPSPAASPKKMMFRTLAPTFLELAARSTSKMMCPFATGQEWPQGEIPYYFDPSCNPAAQAVFTAAAGLITNAVGNKPNNSPYVKFTAKASAAAGGKVKVDCGANVGCSAGLGRTTCTDIKFEQPGCDAGRGAHELIHCLGFDHPMGRNDVANYITVDRTKIQPNAVTQWDRLADGPNTVWTDLGLFDYGSIMMYRPMTSFRTVAAVNANEPCMTVVPYTRWFFGLFKWNKSALRIQQETAAMGNRAALSVQDIAMIKLAYP